MRPTLSALVRSVLLSEAVDPKELSANIQAALQRHSQETARLRAEREERERRQASHREASRRAALEAQQSPVTEEEIDRLKGLASQFVPAIRRGETSPERSSSPMASLYNLVGFSSQVLESLAFFERLPDPHSASSSRQLNRDFYSDLMGDISEHVRRIADEFKISLPEVKYDISGLYRAYANRREKMGGGDAESLREAESEAVKEILSKPTPVQVDLTTQTTGQALERIRALGEELLVDMQRDAVGESAHVDTSEFDDASTKRAGTLRVSIGELSRKSERVLADRLPGDTVQDLMGRITPFFNYHGLEDTGFGRRTGASISYEEMRQLAAKILTEYFTDQLESPDPSFSLLAGTVATVERGGKVSLSYSHDQALAHREVKQEEEQRQAARERAEADRKSREERLKLRAPSTRLEHRVKALMAELERLLDGPAMSRSDRQESVMEVSDAALSVESAMGARLESKGFIDSLEESGLTAEAIRRAARTIHDAAAAAAGTEDYEMDTDQITSVSGSDSGMTPVETIEALSLHIQRIFSA